MTGKILAYQCPKCESVRVGVLSAEVWSAIKQDWVRAPYKFHGETFFCADCGWEGLEEDELKKTEERR